jgi:hypothetical protein
MLERVKSRPISGKRADKVKGGAVSQVAHYLPVTLGVRKAGSDPQIAGKAF